MTSFESPFEEGKPTHIIDFKVDLALSPPEIKDEAVDSFESYITAEAEKIKINYNNAFISEGLLNIYVCKFQTNKYTLHIFGRIKGKELHVEKEVKELNANWHVLNERIRRVLFSSRTILKSYYNMSSLENIEKHLVCFLMPI